MTQRAMVALVLVVFAFAAAAEDPLSLPKCCPEGQVLHPEEWRCVAGVPLVVDVALPVTTTAESVTGTYATEEATAGADATEATEAPFGDDVTTEGPRLRRRRDGGPRWLPPSLRNTTRPLVAGFGALGNLRCAASNGLRLDAAQTHRYLLSENGTLTMRSPTTGGVPSNLEFTPSEYCLDSLAGGGDVAFLLCPCDRLQCISKCCGVEDVLSCDEEGCGCEKKNGTVWDPFSDERSYLPGDITYEILGYNLPACKDGEQWYSYFPATPHHNSPYWMGFPRGAFYTEGGVCGDTLYAGEIPLHYYLIRCVDSAGFDVSLPAAIFYAPQIPAAVLLAVALLVTLCTLPPSLSPFGWAHSLSIACHAAALFVLNASRAVMLFVQPTQVCPSLSFLVYFSLVAAAFWLNATCINMAKGFGMRQGSTNSKKNRRKLFLWYSLYAWGCSLALTGFTAFMWYYPFVPTAMLRPSLTETRTCYGEHVDSPGKSATFAYYYGPTGGLLIINISIWIYTVLKIRYLKKNTSILKKEDSSVDRKSVLLYVKLLSLMGIAEIVMEIAAWASSSTFKQESIFNAVCSFIDLLRAVSIFAMCCCNRRTLRALLGVLRKLGVPVCEGRGPKRTGLTSTAASAETVLSSSANTLSTNYSVDKA